MARPTRGLLVAALALHLPGCGDGLIGMEQLDDLTGFEALDLPENPVWMVRWMMQDGWIDSEPYPIADEHIFVEFEQDEDTEYHYVDYMEVLAPEVGEPPDEAIRGHGSEYLFALGIPLVLEDFDWDGNHDPPMPPEDPADLWGATPFSALLWVDGDLEAFADQQPVGLEMYNPDCDCGFSLHHGTQNVRVEFDVLNMWWEIEAIQSEPENEEWFAELRVLWPDDPHVLSTDHERAYMVQSGPEMDEWFVGGAMAFTAEAWFAWFRDPEESLH